MSNRKKLSQSAGRRRANNKTSTPDIDASAILGIGNDVLDGDNGAGRREREALQNSLVLVDEGVYEYKQFRLTRKGLDLPDKFDINDVNDLGRILAQLDTSVSLWQGDWANIYVALETSEKGSKLSDQESGNIYTRLAEDFKINPKTLRNRASICRNVPVSRRRDTLTLGHYAEVASLDAKTQDQLLKSAELENWSIRELREKVKIIKNHQKSINGGSLQIEATLLDRKPIVYREFKRLYQNAFSGDEEARQELQIRVEEARQWLDEIEEDLQRIDENR